MKMVIYDSVFGNTEQVAWAIGKALGPDEDVEVHKVDAVQPEQLTGLDLLVVGSPTRAFRPTPAMTNFLKSIPDAGLAGTKVAAFDTRIPEDEAPFILRVMIKVFGYAAKPISKTLQKKGGQVVAEPEGFDVTGSEGPLEEGELARATAWAQQLAVA
jgi:flavodoxin